MFATILNQREQTNSTALITRTVHCHTTYNQMGYGNRGPGKASLCCLYEANRCLLSTKPLRDGWIHEPVSHGAKRCFKSTHFSINNNPVHCMAQKQIRNELSELRRHQQATVMYGSMLCEAVPKHPHSYIIGKLVIAWESALSVWMLCTG